MPKSFASDIAAHIVSNNVGTFSLNGSLPLVRVGMEPNVDNRLLLTIYDTGGPPSNPAYQRDEPRIQVRVKAKDEFGYEDAYKLQQDVKDLILGMNRIVINGTLYVGIWQQVDIANLSSDYNNRNILVSSYRTVREYSTSNRKPIE